MQSAQLPYPEHFRIEGRCDKMGVSVDFGARARGNLSLPGTVLLSLGIGRSFPIGFFRCERPSSREIARERLANGLVSRVVVRTGEKEWGI